MQKEEYIRNGKKFVRVNKIKARIKYNEGKTIYLIQDKMRLDNAWQFPYPISKEMEDRENREFDAIVIAFRYYNCDNERGHGVKYFIADTEK